MLFVAALFFLCVLQVWPISAGVTHAPWRWSRCCRCVRHRPSVNLGRTLKRAPAPSRVFPVASSPSVLVRSVLSQTLGSFDPNPRESLSSRTARRQRRALPGPVGVQHLRRAALAHAVRSRPPSVPVLCSFVQAQTVRDIWIGCEQKLFVSGCFGKFACRQSVTATSAS